MSPKGNKDRYIHPSATGQFRYDGRWHLKKEKKNQTLNVSPCEVRRL